jgi:hypothetical protein
MTEERKKKKSGELSRRDFLKDAGLIVGGAALGSTVLLAACAGEPETTTITQTQTKTETATTTATAPGTTVVQTQTRTATTTLPAVTTTTTVAPTTVTVLNPEGPRDPIVRQKLAPRLTTLVGKTIYLVDVNFTATWQLLEELEKLFKERLPNTTVVRKIKAGSYGAADTALWDEVQAKANGFVMATGH